jgi:hypothetical protein
MAPWYESLGHEIANEDTGTDFLNLRKAPANEMKTAKFKARINNVLAHHGGRSHKKGTKEYIEMHRQELTNALEFAADLTKNTLSSSALPIDVQTVRSYDLGGKNFVLPNYQTNDTTTLIPSYLNIVEEAYDSFCVDEKLPTMGTEHSWKGPLMKSSSPFLVMPCATASDTGFFIPGFLRRMPTTNHLYT